MTKQDGYGHLYRLVDRPKEPVKPGMVAVVYNNGPEIHISKDKWEGYEQVADSHVEQGGLEF